MKEYCYQVSECNCEAVVLFACAYGYGMDIGYQSCHVIAGIPNSIGYSRITHFISRTKSPSDFTTVRCNLGINE